MGIRIGALAVKIDDLFRCRQAPVVHARRGERDVAQRWRFELTAILLLLRDLIAAQVQRFLAPAYAGVVKTFVGQQRPAVAGNAVALAAKNLQAALRRLGQRVLISVLEAVERRVAWFKAVDLFHETQDERIIFRDPTLDDVRQHKTWLASLIAEGKRLVTEAPARGGLPDGAAEFKLADEDATLEMLYLWQREWHGRGLPEARRREILKAVFNVEEPDIC